MVADHGDVGFVSSGFVHILKFALELLVKFFVKLRERREARRQIERARRDEFWCGVIIGGVAILALVGCIVLTCRRSTVSDGG